MRRLLRFLFLAAFVAAIVGAISYAIYTDSLKKQLEIYNQRSTLAVETAIAGKVFELTRTAEADFPQHRYITVEQGKPLIEVAEQYNTTIEVLRMANGLLPTVDVGDGGEIIVPQGVQELLPPRRLRAVPAVAGDTLQLLAVRYDIELEQLLIDNPILAGRELLPGDIVFIPEILN